MNTTSLKKRSLRKNTQTWHLVTNHQNLLYILAAGLVMEPSGFGGKHYADSLNAIPGWIPLFRNKIPAQALEQAVSERKHLRPCVVSFDLSGVSGSVQFLSRKGHIRDGSFPVARYGKEDVAIFIRAPLPQSLLSRICFRSLEDRQEFEIAAGDVSNVDLLPCRIEVDELLFSSATDAAWPPIQAGKPRPRNAQKKLPDNKVGDLLGMPEEVPKILEARRTHSPVSEQALGGLLAMLYHSANRSDLGLSVFQRATGLVRDTDGIAASDPILAELPNWLDGSGISERADTPARLYFGVMESLAAEQGQNGSSQPVEVVLGYLNNRLAQLTEEKIRLRLERLIADMRGCFGLGGGTITEIFERNKGSLSRPLLLFCLREHCMDLLEFSHPLLSDAEYLLAGILFGVRDGWLRLPSSLRDPALAAYVMYRMAVAAHQRQGDVLSLPENPIPQPLRACFASTADSWSDNQTAAALEIARTRKWRDCIETVIASVDGSPLDNPRQENGQFIFSGEATSTTEIKRETFLQHLGQWPPIDASLDSRVRMMLDKTCG
ncbi:MAG TPA: hypothetical protein PK667_05860 [Nitrosomonas europaea]|uniref:hypothetical protein n=1 Tax=Nitrosomonas europaea TaxID=915 RepID=UPI0024906326|nr:hypothetical protein [Nitrosomonas europaea]HRO56085.1 hypothetical protein [Nitrosomonas europaea]HRQ08160.1 hypothetical protein [Nitrosomonas europaea]HUM73713.1 hypothetical protein [Nitrosomonas europaea]